MMIEQLLKQLTEEFIQHWNNWEIDSLGKFFQEDVVVYSPYIKMVYPNNTEGMLKGKAAVLGYWRILKSIGFTKKFTQISFQREGQTVYASFLIDNGPEKMHTTYVYNEYAKMSMLKFDYTSE
jgi:hypothetical protein